MVGKIFGGPTNHVCCDLSFKMPVGLAAAGASEKTWSYMSIWNRARQRPTFFRQIGEAFLKPLNLKGHVLLSSAVPVISTMQGVAT